MRGGIDIEVGDREFQDLLCQPVMLLQEQIPLTEFFLSV